MAEENGEEASGGGRGGREIIITEEISDEHLLLSILLLLPLESILCFGMSCKKTMALTRSHTLWKSLCNRDYNHHSTDSNSDAGVVDWYRLYHRLRNLDRVCCFNLITTQQQPQPSPRASHSLNFFSGSLLLFGGGCDGGRHLDDTWIAYIHNNNIVNWKRLVLSGRTPTGRFGHSCVVIGATSLLFGGINDTGIRQNDTWIAQQQQTNTGATLSWRLLDVGPLAPPPRGAHACSSIDNRTMIIHGGIGLSGTRLGDTWLLYLSDNLCFGTWHQTVVTHPHPIPSPRSGHTLTCIGGNKTVLFGGRGMGYEVLNDVWYFDSGHLRWVPVLFDIPAALSLARVGHSATLISGGRVLIYGGEDSYRHRKDDFWLLDITRRKRLWRSLKCEGGYHPKSRSFHRASADESGRYLYVFGGMVDGILQPAEPTGLNFDGQLFVVDLLL